MLSYLNYWKISTSPCYSVLFILELSASHTKYSMLVSLFICIFTVLSYMPAALGVQLVILCLTIHIFSPSLVKDLLDLWLWQHRTNYLLALDFMIILRTIGKLTFLHNYFIHTVNSWHLGFCPDYFCWVSYRCLCYYCYGLSSFMLCIGLTV